MGIHGIGASTRTGFSAQELQAKGGKQAPAVNVRESKPVQGLPTHVEVEDLLKKEADHIYDFQELSDKQLSELAGKLANAQGEGSMSKADFSEALRVCRSVLARALFSRSQASLTPEQAVKIEGLKTAWEALREQETKVDRAVLFNLPKVLDFVTTGSTSTPRKQGSEPVLRTGTTVPVGTNGG